MDAADDLEQAAPLLARVDIKPRDLGFGDDSILNVWQPQIDVVLRPATREQLESEVAAALGDMNGRVVQTADGIAVHYEQRGATWEIGPCANATELLIGLRREWRAARGAILVPMPPWGDDKHDQRLPHHPFFLGETPSGETLSAAARAKWARIFGRAIRYYQRRQFSVPGFIERAEFAPVHLQDELEAIYRRAENEMFHAHDRACERRRRDQKMKLMAVRSLVTLSRARRGQGGRQRRRTHTRRTLASSGSSDGPSSSPSDPPLRAPRGQRRKAGLVIDSQVQGGVR